MSYIYLYLAYLCLNLFIFRLRRELDHCRRQISEQSGQISRLQSELSISQKNEGQYTTKLATALETVEKNMARSNVSYLNITLM